MSLMTERLAGELTAAGAGAIDTELLAWRGVAMNVRAHDSGVAELCIAFDAPLSGRAALRALLTNPETGWSHVITDRGRLARRVLLTPAVWLRRDHLSAALDGFVDGAPSAAAAARAPLYRLRDVGHSAGDAQLAAEAAALMMLHADSRDVRGARCVIPPGTGDARDAMLVGPSVSAVRSRRRDLARNLRPVWARPDIARCVIDTFINHERNAHAQTED